MIRFLRPISWFAAAGLLLAASLATAVDIVEKGTQAGPKPTTSPRPDIQRSTSTPKPTAGAPATSKVAQRWGLLIGIDDYANARDLDYCGADQRALYKSLLAAGFSDEQLFLLHDDAKENRYRPSQRNIQKQLDVVLSLAAEGDLIVLSFSGHGVLLDGKSYLCPNDMTIDDPSTLISLDTVYDRLRDCQATFKLLMIDACRNDPRPGGTRSAAPTEEAKRLAKEIQDTKIPEGVVLLNSCAPGEVSREDPDLGHGVFMNFILEGLKGPADKDGDGAISLYELQSYAVVKTKTHVARRFNDAQRPFYKIEGDATAMEYALLNVARSTATPALKPEPVPLDYNLERSEGLSKRTTSTSPSLSLPNLPSSLPNVAMNSGWMGELFLYYDYSLRVCVYGVVPGGPAHSAGLRAGDRITRVGGQKITRPGQLSQAITASVPGNALMLARERDGAKQDVVVLMGKTPEDHGLARLREAADGGASWAMVKIAFLLGAEGKHAECLQWFRRAADAGDIAAQHNLAGIYELGRHGVGADPAEAFRWCALAAENPEGAKYPDLKASVLLTLGDFYGRGYGTSKDEARGTSLYQQAADLGSLDAMRRLGVYLSSSASNEQDVPRGIALVRKASDAGFPPAQFSLGLLYFGGKHLKQDKILGVEYFHKSAVGGYASAMSALASIYKTGDGVPADLDKAEHWKRQFESRTGKK